MTEGLIDLHTHSTASDGSYSPEDLVLLAKAVELKAVALTDHDTVEGLDVFIETGRKTNLETIPGVELSAHFKTGTLHILGYFINYKDKDFISHLKLLQEARAERNPKIIKKLQNLGINITYDEVKYISGGGQIGRPHIAKVLIEKGIVKDFDTAFNKFLKKGAPAYVEKERIDPRQCVEMIIAANGIPVLAHPFTLHLDNEKLDVFVKQLKDWGLGGIEVYYTEHTPDQVAYYAYLAKKYGLCMTGGSDFHGKNKEGILLGRGYGNLKIPYCILEDLKIKWESEYKKS
ncbi:MAG TPA: PHP domain-containing protein [Candidatus Desulfofervidus auxilii]|uniref:PHP domain-containing protein n=1 Tax=Desulfofervidus auxilii TaxID=1621989 RepID=A0A7V0NEY1_DESA2|nr:PHP domain-containing protein [Candidatus Desulfofervidus auxilii]